MLDNVKIGRKLVGGFLVVAAVAAVIGIVGYINVGKLDRIVDGTNSIDMPTTESLMNLSLAQSSIVLAERALANPLIADPQIRQAQYNFIADHWKMADEAWKTYENMPRTTEETGLWKEVASSFETWKKGHEELLVLTHQKDQMINSGTDLKGETALALDKDVLAAALKARKDFLDSQAKLAQLVQMNREQFKATALAAAAAVNRAKFMLILFTLVGAVAATLLGVFLSRSISTPLSHGVGMMKELAKGHLSQRLRLQRRDEIGELAATMDQLADDLQTQVVGTMQKIAAGDLSSTVTTKDKQDEIAPALSQTIESLRGLVAESQMLTKAAVEGRLATRGQPDKFQGAYREIVQGVNATLDAVIGPLNVAANYVDRISKGDTPPLITDEYLGDFNTIKNNLNTCIASITNLVDEVGVSLVAGRDGDLSKRVNADRQTGVYRKILRALNEILDAVANPVGEVLSAMEKVANRDLTARMKGEYKGDYGRIKEALNQAVANLDEGMQQVALAVEQVASASAQIGNGSQALAQGASEQASSLEEVSSSLQEMASQTKANAGNAKEARGLAEGTRQGANRGLESMTSLSEAMEKIKASSDATAKIVKTIDEIAFQTNLLALNAAVEAARAGDAGKGFAVVAEEVRNLAMRSAEAAKNTANMIEESVKNAESGVALNGAVLAQLKEITTQANKVGEVMTEIAAASEQQSVGIDQVTTAVEQMNQVTQQNAANSEESASAAEELSGQSEELRTMVSRFRLSAEAAGSTSAPRAAAMAARRPKLQVIPGNSGSKERKGHLDPASVIPFEDGDQSVLRSF